jgi:hypothetical protein
MTVFVLAERLYKEQRAMKASVQKMGSRTAAGSRPVREAFWDSILKVEDRGRNHAGMPELLETGYAGP